MKKAVNIEKANFPEVEVIEQIISAKKAGFEGGLFAWYDSVEFFENIEKAKKIGLEIASIHAPFSNVTAMWNEENPEILEKLFKCIKDCDKIGAKTLVCHVYIGFDTTPQVTELGIKNFSLLLDEAEKYDINLAFENTEGVECLYAIKEHLSHRKNCGFCVDTGHELCYNGGRDLLKDFGDKLFFLHINDNLGVTGERIFWTDDAHLMPLTKGKVDWDRFCNNINRLKFNGWLSLELCRFSKPEKHTHDEFINISTDDFYKLAFDSAQRLEDKIME